MDLTEAIQTFEHESAELLELMENALLRLELDPTETDVVNEVFRAAHTIKGSAGLFGFDPVVHFAHHVESVLDRVRDGSLSINAEITALLLAAGDHIGALIRVATEAEPPNPALELQNAALLARLEPLLSPRAAAIAASMRPRAAADARTPAVAARARAAPPAPAELGEEWNIHLGFGRDVLRSGMDPLAFLRYLARLGEIRAMYVLGEALPPAQQMDPESCYLGFDITFRSAASQAEIENVFEFVRDDCAIVVRRRQPTLPPPTLATTSSRAPAKRSRPAAAPAPAADNPIRAPHPPAAEREPRSRALVKPDAPEPSRAEAKRDGRLIRVDAEKLDQLIDLVGELMIAGAGSRLHAERSGLSALLEATASVVRLVEEVQSAALGLRMVAIGATFQRFHRVVRDVSRELGKDIELVIEGADTELDKSMVEKLGDPLLHLVRNAIDHGIESVEARREAGKSERGRLGLNAYHDSGSVVVEVSDDGRGLRRERILEKAVALGLRAPDQNLSDREVFDLIFEAGFSTADKVSN